MKAEYLERHVFEVNPESNGGEAIFIITDFSANGDPITANDGVFINQSIELHSYGNMASINLFNASLTPEKLRQLANELEQTRNKLIK